MADYRELLRRAIDALPENNGTARRAVYEKARSALVTQLHAIEPSIPPREITQHRLTLEDCIRQVEQEATEKLLQGLSHREQEAVEEATPAPAIPPEEELAEEDVADATPAPAVEEEPTSDDKPTDETQDADAPNSTPDDESADEEPAAAEKTVQEDAPASDEEAEAAADDSAEDSFEHAPIDDDFEAEAEAEGGDEAPAEDTADDEDDALSAGDDAPTEASNASDVSEQEQSADDDADEALDDDYDGDDAEDADDEIEESADSKKSPDKTSIDDLVNQLEAAGDDQKNYGAASIDDVIAQARAASSTDAPTPNVLSADKPPSTSKNIEAALSSVREVDVDPDDPDADDAEDDDAQAAIDRALMALDREAEGKKTANADDELMDESSQGAITAATRDDPEMIEDNAEFVEDEQTGGGGGLLVFLGVVVLLIALLGGGAYWAWREGFVNLDPIIEQVGLSDFIAGDPSEDPVEDQPSDQTETPPETNVRDVTQGNIDTAVPSGEVDARLTPEVDDSQAATPEPTDTASAEGTDVETNASEDTVAPDDTTTAPETDNAAADSGTETAASEDARLPSADDTPVADDTAENPLNVQDPNAQVATGAQSLLIEEQTSGSGGAVPFSGQTEWTRDVDELGLPTIRAVASIPARNLSVDVLIRKNSDEALPASHLIEVNFSVTDSFLGGSIASLPGVLMKDQELAQGTTLVGASVRIVDNSFLFAMSGSESDVARNIELLGQNGWLDLPLIYSTGRKAIMTLEKGARGTELFEEVLAEWAEN